MKILKKLITMCAECDNCVGFGLDRYCTKDYECGIVFLIDDIYSIDPRCKLDDAPEQTREKG